MCRFVYLLVLLLLSTLSACSHNPAKTVVHTTNEASQSHEPTVKADPTPVPLTEEQKAIAILLSDADLAFTQKKYLNPVNDNAHDRYRSVLLMEPGNEHALQGLQMIAMKYVEMARNSAMKGNFSDAQMWLKYARSMGDNPLVQGETESLRKQMLNIGTNKPNSSEEAEWVLDAKQLQSKDTSVAQKLASVAKKAKETDQFVLIVARSDAEGRWIYQQLRTAVPGYLVRGDIRLGAPARVKLVKSLD